MLASSDTDEATNTRSLVLDGSGVSDENCPPGTSSLSVLMEKQRWRSVRDFMASPLLAPHRHRLLTTEALLQERRGHVCDSTLLLIAALNTCDASQRLPLQWLVLRAVASLTRESPHRTGSASSTVVEAFCGRITTLLWVVDVAIICGEGLVGSDSSKLESECVLRASGGKRILQLPCIAAVLTALIQLQILRGAWLPAEIHLRRLGDLLPTSRLLKWLPQLGAINRPTSQGPQELLRAASALAPLRLADRVASYRSSPISQRVVNLTLPIPDSSSFTLDELADLVCAAVGSAPGLDPMCPVAVRWTHEPPPSRKRPRPATTHRRVSRRCLNQAQKPAESNEGLAFSEVFRGFLCQHLDFDDALFSMPVVSVWAAIRSESVASSPLSSGETPETSSKSLGCDIARSVLQYLCAEEELALMSLVKAFILSVSHHVLAVELVCGSAATSPSSAAAPQRMPLNVLHSVNRMLRLLRPEGSLAAAALSCFGRQVSPREANGIVLFVHLVAYGLFYGLSVGDSVEIRELFNLLKLSKQRMAANSTVIYVHCVYMLLTVWTRGDDPPSEALRTLAGAIVLMGSAEGNTIPMPESYPSKAALKKELEELCETLRARGESVEDLEPQVSPTLTPLLVSQSVADEGTRLQLRLIELKSVLPRNRVYDLAKLLGGDQSDLSILSLSCSFDTDSSRSMEFFSRVFEDFRQELRHSTSTQDEGSVAVLSDRAMCTVLKVIEMAAAGLVSTQERGLGPRCRPLLQPLFSLVNDLLAVVVWTCREVPSELAQSWKSSLEYRWGLNPLALQRLLVAFMAVLDVISADATLRGKLCWDDRPEMSAVVRSLCLPAEYPQFWNHQEAESFTQAELVEAIPAASLLTFSSAPTFHDLASFGTSDAPSLLHYATEDVPITPASGVGIGLLHPLDITFLLLGLFIENESRVQPSAADRTVASHDRPATPESSGPTFVQHVPKSSLQFAALSSMGLVTAVRLAICALLRIATLPLLLDPRKGAHPLLVVHGHVEASIDNLAPFRYLESYFELASCVLELDAGLQAPKVKKTSEVTVPFQPPFFHILVDAWQAFLPIPAPLETHFPDLTRAEWKPSFDVRSLSVVHTVWRCLLLSRPLPLIHRAIRETSELSERLGALVWLPAESDASALMTPLFSRRPQKGETDAVSGLSAACVEYAMDVITVLLRDIFGVTLFAVAESLPKPSVKLTWDALSLVARAFLADKWIYDDTTLKMSGWFVWHHDLFNVGAQEVLSSLELPKSTSVLSRMLAPTVSLLEQGSRMFNNRALKRPKDRALASFDEQWVQPVFASIERDFNSKSGSLASLLPYALFHVCTDSVDESGDIGIDVEPYTARFPLRLARRAAKGRNLDLEVFEVDVPAMPVREVPFRSEVFLHQLTQCLFEGRESTTPWAALLFAGWSQFGCPVVPASVAAIFRQFVQPQTTWRYDHMEAPVEPRDAFHPNASKPGRRLASTVSEIRSLFALYADLDSCMPPSLVRLGHMSQCLIDALYFVDDRWCVEDYWITSLSSQQCLLTEARPSPAVRVKSHPLPFALTRSYAQTVAVVGLECLALDRVVNGPHDGFTDRLVADTTQFYPQITPQDLGVCLVSARTDLALLHLRIAEIQTQPSDMLFSLISYVARVGELGCAFFKGEGRLDLASVVVLPEEGASAAVMRCVAHSATQILEAFEGLNTNCGVTLDGDWSELLVTALNAGVLSLLEFIVDVMASLFHHWSEVGLTLELLGQSDHNKVGHFLQGQDLSLACQAMSLVINLTAASDSKSPLDPFGKWLPLTSSVSHAVPPAGDPVQCLAHFVLTNKALLDLQSLGFALMQDHESLFEVFPGSHQYSRSGYKVQRHVESQLTIILVALLLIFQAQPHVDCGEGLTPFETPEKSPVPQTSPLETGPARNWVPLGLLYVVSRLHDTQRSDFSHYRKSASSLASSGKAMAGNVSELVNLLCKTETSLVDRLLSLQKHNPDQSNASIALVRYGTLRRLLLLRTAVDELKGAPLTPDARLVSCLPGSTHLSETSLTARIKRFVVNHAGYTLPFDHSDASHGSLCNVGWRRRQLLTKVRICQTALCLAELSLSSTLFSCLNWPDPTRLRFPTLTDTTHLSVEHFKEWRDTLPVGGGWGYAPLVCPVGAKSELMHGSFRVCLDILNLQCQNVKSLAEGLKTGQIQDHVYHPDAKQDLNTSPALEYLLAHHVYASLVSLIGRLVRSLPPVVTTSSSADGRVLIKAHPYHRISLLLVDQRMLSLANEVLWHSRMTRYTEIPASGVVADTMKPYLIQELQKVCLAVTSEILSKFCFYGVVQAVTKSEPTPNTDNAIESSPKVQWFTPMLSSGASYGTFSGMQSFSPQVIDLTDSATEETAVQDPYVFLEGTPTTQGAIYQMRGLQPAGRVHAYSSPFYHPASPAAASGTHPIPFCSTGGHVGLINLASLAACYLKHRASDDRRVLSPDPAEPETLLFVTEHLSDYSLVFGAPSTTLSEADLRKALATLASRNKRKRPAKPRVTKPPKSKKKEPKKALLRQTKLMDVQENGSRT